jgi:DNA-binding transcriptional ArsR family regulator
METEEVGSLDTLRIITGPDAIEAYRALSDETRRIILHALRAKRMSSSELVDFLSNQDPTRDVKPQTVRYHIKELEKCGLVQQDGYEPAGNGDSHIMQKMWRATAENVFLATGDMDGLPERASYDLDKTLDIVGTLSALGMEMQDDREMEDLAQAFMKRDQLYMRGLEFAKENLRDVCELDPKLYVLFRRILSVVRLNDPDYEDYWQVSRLITDVLRSAYKRGKGKNPLVI